MPYESTSELPKAIRVDLPPHAQRIYMEAYNEAHRDSGEDDFAEQAAWDAVNAEYEQDAAGDWHRKDADPIEEIVTPEES
jgi:cation transport regulator